MVGDVEPIADLGAAAVNGDVFAVKGFFNHKRDEFFRVLAGAVVVGAVGGDNRELIGMMVGADEVVAGGF